MLMEGLQVEQVFSLHCRAPISSGGGIGCLWGEVQVLRTRAYTTHSGGPSIANMTLHATILGTKKMYENLA